MSTADYLLSQPSIEERLKRQGSLYDRVMQDSVVDKFLEAQTPEAQGQYNQVNPKQKLVIKTHSSGKTQVFLKHGVIVKTIDDTRTHSVTKRKRWWLPW